MRLTFSAVIIAMLCSCGYINAQTLRIGDNQPFRIHVNRLSTARRRSILQNLEPALQRRAEEFDLDAAELAEARNSLLARQVRTSAGTILLIETWGLPMCGGTGNCSVFALGKRDSLILESAGDRLTLLHTIHHGLPSILIYEHMSAFQSGLTWYSFDGSQYRPVSCGVETYSDVTRTYTPPLIERGPCEK